MNCESGLCIKVFTALATAFAGEWLGLVIIAKKSCGDKLK